MKMFKRIEDAKAMWKAVGQYEKIREDVDNMNTKHLLMSKTFWANVAGLAVTLGDVLPQKWAAPTLVVANIILRLISNQPVGLFPSAK